MTTYKLNRRLMLIALMLIMGAFFIMGTTAYAAAPEQADLSADDAGQGGALLTVKEVWLTGDTLHISVSDSLGEAQTLELNLRDYAMPADEYVTVQASDSAGNTSNAIQFKNPYYTAGAEQPPSDGEAADAPDGGGESAVPDGIESGGSPLTPDGTGSVADNVTEADGKEFFTVETADGNTFYLIVDRQRDTDNVYLLNAVTENDLASLAKDGDGLSVSAVETAPPTAVPSPEETEPSPAPEPEKSGGGNTGTLAFVGVAVLILGGAAYYFKFVRPKKNGAAASDFEPDDFEDEEMDVEDENDEDEDGEDE